MISFIKGQLFKKSEGYLDVDVRGVGYRVLVTEQFAGTLHVTDEVFAYTHHHVREDAQVLFGFPTEADKEWFELLITVSGIGPKGALQIVNAISAATFVDAVLADDVKKLCDLPGVGKKTAQRVIVELKDKVQNLWYFDVATSISRSVVPTLEVPVSSTAADVLEALKMLGYSEKQAFEAVETVLMKDSTLSTELALKACLQVLYTHSASWR